MPHKRGWRRDGVVAAAWAYNEPLIAIWLSGSLTGQRAVRDKVSFLRTSENIVVTVLRREGRSLLVRTLEVHGERATAELRWHEPVRLKGPAEPVNALGDRLDGAGNPRWDGRVLKWRTRPQGIDTWRWLLP